MRCARRLFLAVSCVAAGALFSACGGDDDAGDDEEEVNCAEETRDDEYVAGLEKAGERWTFALVDAVPAPPDKGDNTWTVHITDGDAVALEGLSLTVTPFMPDHGHGTPIEAVASDQSGGDYDIAPVNMWMPGLWEVTVEAEADDESDTVLFAFCVQG